MASGCSKVCCQLHCVKVWVGGVAGDDSRGSAREATKHEQADTEGRQTASCSCRATLQTFLKPRSCPPDTQAGPLRDASRPSLTAPPLPPPPTCAVCSSTSFHAFHVASPPQHQTSPLNHVKWLKLAKTKAHQQKMVNKLNPPPITHTSPRPQPETHAPVLCAIRPASMPSKLHHPLICHPTPPSALTRDHQAGWHECHAGQPASRVNHREGGSVKVQANVFAFPGEGGHTCVRVCGVCGARSVCWCVE